VAETDTFFFRTAFANPTTPAVAISVPPGTYLARVRVDATESRLTVDSTGGFDGPLVTLP
jgi:hypothetical protein